jgi:hypothetical protein
MNGEVKVIWRKSVLAYPKYCPYYLESLNKTTKRRRPKIKTGTS